MDRWVVVYDDADRTTLEDHRLPLRHWARRTGSPLLDRRLNWVPASRVSALGRFEQCDLVLFRSAEPIGGGVWTHSVPRRVQDILDRLTLDDACLAVEYTAAMPANSNALGRIGRLLDHVRAGIPTVYAVPRAGYEGRDEGRGQGTSAIRGLYDTRHQRRIERNGVLSVESLSRSAFHYRELGRWVPLYALCLADTYSARCAVVLLPDAVKTCPPIWRHSGAELAPLYQVINRVVRSRSRPSSTDPTFRRIRAETERFVANGTRARPEPPPEWQQYTARYGHPNGSRQHADGRDHLPLSVTATGAEVISGDLRLALNKLLVRLGLTATHKIGRLRLPAAWNSRGLLVDLAAPPEDHWREKTYVCRLLALELCFLRANVRARQRPWAMSTDPRARNHVVAAAVPVTSQTLWRVAESDVYARRWIDFADILILKDGLFLGELWSRAPRVRRAV